jgi:hypothetical protein
MGTIIVDLEQQQTIALLADDRVDGVSQPI